MPLPPGFSTQATVSATQGSQKANVSLQDIADLGGGATSGATLQFAATIFMEGQLYEALFTVVDGLITSIDPGDPVQI